MSISTTIAIAAVSLVALTFIWRSHVSPRLKRWKEYTKQIATCGYLAPAPTDKGLRSLQRFSRFMTFLQVGKIDVVGRENLDAVPGPFMYSSNHPFGVDVAVIPLVINRKARYMAHETVFTFAWGLGAHIVGPWGAFVAHDSIRDNGVRARAAATRVLTTGQNLVLLPEGLTNMEPTMLPFKDGAVRIIKQAAKELGHDVWIIPAFMRYGKYPKGWIQKFPRPIQYMLTMLLFPLFRRGVKVVIGKPIPASAFAADDAEATLELRAAIEALDPKTVK
ncbi:MAG: 1-acyl-sn-glycerol-3-phosphate acyltransferase [Candidatus Melainabacteria bacterium]|nr:1-acyl-sn-glycerol-3-phosphate acyltransferase [Candidatus Melainabacteria bacterium]